MKRKEKLMNDEICPLGFRKTNAYEYDAYLRDMLLPALRYLELFGYEMREDERINLYDLIACKNYISARDIRTFASAVVNFAYRMWLNMKEG